MRRHDTWIYLDWEILVWSSSGIIYLNNGVACNSANLLKYFLGEGFHTREHLWKLQSTQRFRLANVEIITKEWRDLNEQRFAPWHNFHQDKKKKKKKKKNQTKLGSDNYKKFHRHIVYWTHWLGTLPAEQQQRQFLQKFTWISIIRISSTPFIHHLYDLINNAYIITTSTWYSY